MNLTKADLDSALEEQSRAIIDVIQESATDTRNDILDRIDKLENTYALDARVSRIEKKLGLAAH